MWFPAHRIKFFIAFLPTHLIGPHCLGVGLPEGKVQCWALLPLGWLTLGNQLVATLGWWCYDRSPVAVPTPAPSLACGVSLRCGVPAGGYQPYPSTLSYPLAMVGGKFLVCCAANLVVTARVSPLVHLLLWWWVEGYGLCACAGGWLVS